MFCEVVGSVVFSFCPIEVELTLCNTVLDPVVTHVERLQPFHADLRSKDVVSGRVVGFEGGSLWRL